MTSTKFRPASLAALTMLAGSFAAMGQTAIFSGDLSAFDVINDTGQPAHGFEIQLEGALPGDLYYTFPSGRYGSPSVVPYSTGVYVRWQASYSAGTGAYTAATPVGGAPTFAWQDCYMGGTGYPTSGCEHFGQGMRPLPAGHVITVTGRWMLDDPANPGQLISVDPPAAIPFPVWLLNGAAGGAPVLAATVTPVRPARALYGEAFWVKIFKTDQSRSVGGDELLSTNPAVVPEDATQVESPWVLMQAPPPGVNGKHGSHSNQSALSIVTGAVVRRYEMYKYTGTYDPATHEALCADLVCNAPATGELGVAVSAQNGASNVVADSLSVTKTGTGSGNATVTGGSISCGNACAAFGTNGASFTLTANPGSTIFTGWSGACSGTQLTCTGTINGKTAATANFMLQHTLSVGRSNTGTLTATPSGNDRPINCGGTCSAKFTDGTVVTLTATPPAGKSFVNWSGGCSGTASTCTLTMGKDTSVQAVFSK